MNARGSPRSLLWSFGAIAVALLAIAGASSQPDASDTRLELVVQSGGEGVTLDLAFSPDGRWLAVTSSTAINLWELSTNRIWRTFQGCNGAVTSIVFSSDGRWLASSSEDKTIRHVQPRCTPSRLR
jgi:WD40 repeat protein